MQGKASFHSAFVVKVSEAGRKYEEASPRELKTQRLDKLLYLEKFIRCPKLDAGNEVQPNRKTPVCISEEKGRIPLKVKIQRK